MALAEALGELGECARGQKSRSSGTTPTGGSRGPGQSRLILIRTPLLTSKQLPAHENTAPAHLLSLCCASFFAVLRWTWKAGGSSWLLNDGSSWKTTSKMICSWVYWWTSLVMGMSLRSGEADMVDQGLAGDLIYSEIDWPAMSASTVTTLQMSLCLDPSYSAVVIECHGSCF